MLRIIVLCLLCLGTLSTFGQDRTVSGYLVDDESGEALLFATVVIKGTSVGTSTNEYGFWSLTLPSDTAELVFSFLGYQNHVQEIVVGRDASINIKLSSRKTELKEFEVVAEQTPHKEELQSTRMSMTRMNVSEIKTIPSIGGETDVIKVMQLLPGVSKGAEGGTGMFVRGGDADQNLVILDEAVVYNTGHLFGFFSVFNPDAIKDLTMIKGAFPANYGGRLSSVLDIRMKEGHNKKIHGEGGVGLLSSRLTLEGPIKKETTSFMIAGRRTYIDQVFKLAKINIPYYFYDLNAKVNHKFSDRDRLFFSSYFGDDVLSLDEQDEDDAALNFGFRLGNFTQTLRWNHVYNTKLFSNVSLIHNKFQYNINGRYLSNSLLIRSEVVDWGGKIDFSYYRKPKQTFKFGAAITDHIFRPNIVSTAGDVTDFLSSSEGQRQTTYEFAVYGDMETDLSPVWRLSAGFRMTGADVTGKTYFGPEPRVGLRYRLSDLSSVKASYSRMNQYIHRVSSSSVALPTDLWYPVSAQIKPQSADQVAIGYQRSFDKLKSFLTVEAYYKSMRNLIEYREGANLILNNNFEDQLLQGNGRAWGLEMMLKKDEGRLTGWLAYTLSWTDRQFDDLNGGRKFWAKYDRRHIVSVVGVYKISDHWDFSAVWEYSTGSRFTALVGQYFAPNASLTSVDIIPVYTDRNAVQLSASHRLDVNFVRKTKPKNPDRKYQAEWHFGAYNVYNRASPYRVNVTPDGNGGYRYTQPGLFGFIPSIAYNFKF